MDTVCVQKGYSLMFWLSLNVYFEKFDQLLTKVWAPVVMGSKSSLRYCQMSTNIVTLVPRNISRANTPLITVSLQK